MNKADRYRMAKQVEVIRQLQWNKAQQQASNARKCADQADVAVDRAQQKATAYASLTRQALTSTHTLSPALLSVLTHAAGAARSDLQGCQETAAMARTQWRQKMETLQHRQTQQHEAAGTAERARKACRRQLEEKQASAMEDRWLALSYRVTNQPSLPIGKHLSPSRSEKP